MSRVNMKKSSAAALLFFISRLSAPAGHIAEGGGPDGSGEQHHDAVSHGPGHPGAAEQRQPFSPARMPISRARPSTTFSSCTHQTARVSKWIYRRSSHQAMPKPTVAPSSFQPFSCPWARLAASTSAGKG